MKDCRFIDMYGCVNKDRVPKLEANLELSSEIFRLNEFFDKFENCTWNPSQQIIGLYTFRFYFISNLLATCCKRIFSAQRKLRIFQKNVSQLAPVTCSELKNFRIETKLRLSNDFWEWLKMSQVKSREQLYISWYEENGDLEERLF